MSEIKSLGQVTFEAYRAEVKTAFNGDPIPPWDQLDNGAPARRGWEAAAQAIRQHVRMIDALAAVPDGQLRRDFRDGQRSRWQPVGNPVAKHEPDPAPPVGDGGPVGGWYLTEAVPVDVEPDDCDHPESCDIHGHEG